MKVGIFDSGIGGLTILYELNYIYPHNFYYYYADNLHMPYGNKSYNEIKKYFETAISFFCDKKIDVLVVACNTVSCYLEKEFKNVFPFKIITIKPQILEASKFHKNLVLLATPNTLKSKIVLKDLMHINKNSIAIFDTTNLAKMTEENAPRFYKNIDYINKLLENVENNSGIILGCTHYHYYKKLIENMGYKCYTPTAKVIEDLSKIKVKDNYLHKNCDKEKSNQIEIFLSDSFEISKYKAICDKLLN